MKKSRVIVFLGPQGSGKGTQAERLSKKIHYPAYSAGQLYRNEVEKGTPLGRKAKKIMERGAFMPTRDTNALMRKYLTPARCRHGVILDGYPRTLEQMRANNKLCQIDLVFFINLSDTEAVRRLSLRRTCTACKTNYHLTFAPPAKNGRCARCGGVLLQRTDDKPAAIRKRLRHFHRAVMPVIRAYAKRGVVREIDGSKSITEVWRAVQEAVRAGRGGA